MIGLRLDFIYQQPAKIQPLHNSLLRSPYNRIAKKILSPHNTSHIYRQTLKKKINKVTDYSALTNDIPNGIPTIGPPPKAILSSRWNLGNWSWMI